MILIVLIIKTSILSGGWVCFVSKARSGVIPGTSLGASCHCLGLHIFTATMYLSWAKHTHTRIKAV